MDAPLLALTRRATPPNAATPGMPPDAIAAGNMRQLVQLRWLAVLGQLATVLGVRFGLGVPLPLLALLAVIAGLAGANLLFTALLRRTRVTNGIMLAALLVDVGSLAVQLYLTGGAENPFISLFLVQVVLGAILLEAWWVWLLVAVTCASFAMLTFVYRPLLLPPALLPHAAGLYTLGGAISFVLVSALLVLFSTRISRNLRAREAYLADLRTRAAEEEQLARMGLFASGAAHELGTPLATLSVILGDWRRMPRVANDPELAGEVAEMEAELGRCKAIVTDILNAAGQPRGHALGRTPAGPFLDEVVAAWREHPHAPASLDYRRDALAGATLVADPALRQAVWNLLDNAAEASPAGLEMTVAPVDGALVVAVADRGAGLPAAILADPGTPVASRKGEGHGVGLYLAATVARRLGGRLEAANRVGGGAELRLVLPLEER